MTDTLELWDVCKPRHRGNAESVAANERAQHTKQRNLERVLEACRRPHGVTCRELAKEWGVGMNQISGRFTELKCDKQIRKIGVRDGCGVYVAV